MAELTWVDWTLLGAAAVLVGVAKTAIGGVASLSVALFAFVLPARESTGALLPLLLVGDLVALTLYRRHADLAVLVRLLPSVIPGLALGAWFVAYADQALMQRGIGAVLLVMAGLQVWTRWGAGRKPLVSARLHGIARAAAPVGVGVMAGFATMTANAAGPIMTIYLLLAGLSIMELLGTGAWFFFLVNLAKVPFSAGLDLMSGTTLMVDLILVPFLFVGAALGSVLARRIERRRFEDVTLVLTVVAATGLLA